MSQGSMAVQFPYGAVYFRKSNPPREDWKRDYHQAAADGMNTFRHWFMWSAIETAPGTYDWSDYDEHLDLAAEHGIRTIIAEHITFAPEWAYRRFAGCELRSHDGHVATSLVSPSSAVGGHPGLCLDHAPVREAAEQFLRTLVERYRDHPGLGGYDLWNECNIPSEYCYCEQTADEFRKWLEQRYGSLSVVAQTWRRYSLADWADVRPPHDRTGYPEMLDWLQFRIEHAYARFRWRVELVRSLDPDHTITAHGIAASLNWLAENAADDWRSAAEVDSYGLTWVVARKGSEPWRQWSAIDLVRNASRGKPFWHAEMQGGPLWLQPQVIGRPRDDGRIAAPEDVRLWNLVSLAGGARGLMYLRWRPLLDGPLFDAFGPYSPAGQPTERSAQASRVAKWANAAEQADVVRAMPIKGDLGIVVVPDTQLLTYIQRGDAAAYTNNIWGAYQGFFDHNVQADYVHIDDIDNYAVLYLPMPLMLTSDQAAAVRRFVANGGTLISEGCPGFFTDHGHMCPEQPGSRLAELFGATGVDVEFTPDLLEHGEDRFVMGGAPVPCAIYRQRYELAGGQAAGRYLDGSIAAVEHRNGSGRTLLVGTCVGAAYASAPEPATRAFFAGLLSWAGVDQHVVLDEPGVVARIHQSEERRFLWVTNAARAPRRVRARVNARFGAFSSALDRWGGTPATVRDGLVEIEVPGRDAAILELR